MSEENLEITCREWAIWDNPANIPVKWEWIRNMCKAYLALKADNERLKKELAKYHTFSFENHSKEDK